MSEEKAQLILPKSEELVVSSSPHVQVKESVTSIMVKVLIALLPAAIAAIYYFGINAIMVMILTTLFAVGAEALWCYIAKKSVWGTIKDGSALVTGILLSMNLSASTPWWVCLIGAFLAIWLGKQIFGGLGYNPFNPALVARVGLLIALPGIMTTWVPTKSMVNEVKEKVEKVEKVAFVSNEYLTSEDIQKLRDNQEVDTVTCATPLGVAKNLADERGGFLKIDNCSTNTKYFFGNIGGCLGETSALALLIGGLLLLWWKLINWRIPVYFIGTVFIVTGILHFFIPTLTPSPMFHILTGGLMLGAFFMATDMVTSPMTNNGAIVFAVGCGVITSVIRVWGNYPEGVSFSILFMNALVPLIDKFFTRRVFGAVKIEKGR